MRNGENYIREAVCSALGQSSHVIEVLVIDDGSTDQTRQVLETIDDPRLKVTERHAGSSGVSAVRNQGLGAASGDFVMFLDADDRLQLGAINALVSALHETDVAVYGDYQRIDESGSVIGQRHRLAKRQKPSGDILVPLVSGNFIVNGGIMLVKRALFQELGGFDPKLAYAEDWLAWCRLAASGPIRYVPDLHVLDYRVHSTSVMMKKPLELSDCLPAVEAVFNDEAIIARLNTQERSKLRAHAIAHMQAYCIAQATRSKRYIMAARDLTRVLISQPKRFPRMAAMAAAAFLGL